MRNTIQGFLDRFFGRCALERRKKKSFVVVERRQRVTQKLAAEQMYASIDRFAHSVEKLKARR